MSRCALLTMTVALCHFDRSEKSRQGAPWLLEEDGSIGRDCHVALRAPHNDCDPVISNAVRNLGKDPSGCSNRMDHSSEIGTS